MRSDENPISAVYESVSEKGKAKRDALVNYIQSTSSDQICSLRTGRKDVVISKLHSKC